MVVLFSHARHPQGLYSAVETGTTFFSRSFPLTFLPLSLARPGTGAGGASRGRLNVWFTMRSSVVHAEIFRALSSLYWPVQWTTAPASKPCIHVSGGAS